MLRDLIALRRAPVGTRRQHAWHAKTTRAARTPYRVLRFAPALGLALGLAGCFGGPTITGWANTDHDYPGSQASLDALADCGQEQSKTVEECMRGEGWRYVEIQRIDWSPQLM